MRLLGAKVVLTPRAAKGFGMYQKAVELAQANGWFLAHQFETEANAEIHEATTAREILGDFKGERLDYFVTGYGTGGTVVGVARVLRRERPKTKIILSEPANAQLVGSGSGPETRRRRRAGGQPSGIRAASDPGMDARFHSARAAGGDRQEVLRPASFPSAAPMASSGHGRSRRRKGSSAASPSGATFAAAMQIAEKAEPGSGHSVHAARHGRALPHHAAVRGYPRGHDRRGACHLEVDAGLSAASGLATAGSARGLKPRQCAQPFALAPPSRRIVANPNTHVPRAQSLPSEISFRNQEPFQSRHSRAGIQHCWNRM